MTTAQAAQELDIGTRWLARLVQRRAIIPAMKLPGTRGAFVFERSTVEAYKCQREAHK